MPREGFIAVDWGSSNRRIYVIGADGALNESYRDDLGVLSIRPGQFGALIVELQARFGHLPLILAGMIGSNRGWIEVPYVPCPVDIEALAAGVKRLGDGSIIILPGVCQIDGDRADVMRGEELQILGASQSGLIAADAPVCHPGTHTKWIELRERQIVAFRTVMTGEMFSLLRKHSISSHLLRGGTRTDAAFMTGVEHGLAHDDLLAELFSIRARVLLGQTRSSDAPSYASGLLIGSDLRIGLSFARPGADVMLVGDPYLTGLYATALDAVPRGSRRLDGEEAFLAGAKLLAEQIL